MRDKENGSSLAPLEASMANNTVSAQQMIPLNRLSRCDGAGKEKPYNDMYILTSWPPTPTLLVNSQ
jgi:hypothetical protein